MSLILNFPMGTSCNSSSEMKYSFVITQGCGFSLSFSCARNWLVMIAKLSERAQTLAADLAQVICSDRRLGSLGSRTMAMSRLESEGATNQRAFRFISAGINPVQASHMIISRHDVSLDNLHRVTICRWVHGLDYRGNRVCPGP